MLSSAGKKWIVVALVAVTAWFGASMAFWVDEPLHDYAPTGNVPNLGTPDPNDTVETSIRVACRSPWSASAGPLDDLPVLEAPRAYQDTPCAASHRDARLILFLDIAVVALAFAAGAFLLTRRAAIATPKQPALA